jgi:hypothetical protein
MSHLSVIVPVYKVESYLPACVDSLLAQQMGKALEIILVDDGSPDQCPLMCDEYARHHAEIRVVHQENRGLSGARNAGLRVATSPYVTFVDSDDTLASDTYPRLLQLLDADATIDLLEFPVLRKCGTPKPEMWSEEEEVDVRGKEAVWRYWITHFGYRHTYAWNKIYRRSLFARHEFPEGRVFEDILSICPILQQVHHYHFAPIGAYHYYARPASISRTLRVRPLRDLLDGHLDIQRAMAATEGVRPWQQEHLCTVTDTLITLIDAVSVSTTSTQHKDIIIADDPSIAPLWRELDALRPTVRQLLRLPMPLYARLKNLPFVLFGARFHCLLYHRLHRKR